MARRRKWRTSLQQQNPTASADVSVNKKIDGASTIQPIALPVKDLRRVSLIVCFLFALLGGVVALIHSGSNATMASEYIGRVLHIRS